jgi:hypothetical protein
MSATANGGSREPSAERQLDQDTRTGFFFLNRLPATGYRLPASGYRA